MPREQIFGEIALTCGPSGPGPDGRLAFTSGRVNVFIGPNNAGKSLMLRELSGMEPRGHGNHRSEWLPGKLVSRVDYGREAEDLLADEIKDRCLNSGDEVHDALRRLPWRELMQTLREREGAAQALVEELHDNITNSTLVGRLPPGLVSLLRSGQPTADIQMLMVLVALAGEAEDPLIAQPANELVRHLIERGVQLLALPGLDLSAQGLLGPLRPGAAIHETIQSFSSAMTQSLPPNVIADASSLLPPEAARVKRLLELSPWALEPHRWAALRAELERRFEERSWGHRKPPEPLRRSVLYLDGLTRLEITASARQRGYNPELRDHAVSVLLDNEDLRQQLRANVHDALGQWLVVDMVTDAPHVHLRLSKVEPGPGLEQRRDGESDAFLKAAELLAERSDGIHAYIGILAAILTSNARLVFIDEPEAFLHPSLARILGRQLADLARRGEIQLFIATHSPDLLAGCVTGDPDARVVRLSHLHGQGRAWMLDNRELRRFTTDPRLRSAPALSGLFTQAVVIGEGDSDRVFYQEIFERLNEWTGDGRLPRRAEGWTFTNLQNWQTEHLLLGPLRQMGVPAVAVVDRDVLFATDTTVTALLLAAGVPAKLASTWRQTLAQLRPDGAADPVRVDEIVREMARYGVFVAPVGTVEDWLTPDVRREPKKTWVARAFHWLGLDPADPGYRQPEAGGVWDFMRGIAAWVDDPHRLGMPAAPR